MSIDASAFILIAAAYLLGSLSSAIITCKAMNLDDPRTVGSKNPGATNVLRIGGKKAAAFTLAGDLLKGLIPILIAKFMGVGNTVLIMTGLAAFLGHLYPMFYHFKGGKGVATAIGVYIGVSHFAALIIVGIWFICTKLLKISSLAALIATLLAPIVFFVLTKDPAITVGIFVITVLIYWRHRSNIKNLLDGTEGKIGVGKQGNNQD